MAVLTVSEVAARWKCGTDSVYRMIKSGRLKAFRIGQDYRIREAEVERYEDGGGADE